MSKTNCPEPNWSKILFDLTFEYLMLVSRGKKLTELEARRIKEIEYDVAAIEGSMSDEARRENRLHFRVFETIHHQHRVHPKRCRRCH